MNLDHYSESLPPVICDIGDSDTAAVSLGRKTFTNDDVDLGDKGENEPSHLQTRLHSP